VFVCFSSKDVQKRSTFGVVQHCFYFWIARGCRILLALGVSSSRYIVWPLLFGHLRASGRQWLQPLFEGKIAVWERSLTERLKKRTEEERENFVNFKCSTYRYQGSDVFSPYTLSSGFSPSSRVPFSICSRNMLLIVLLALCCVLLFGKSVGHFTGLFLQLLLLSIIAYCPPVCMMFNHVYVNPKKSEERESIEPLELPISLWIRVRRRPVGACFPANNTYTQTKQKLKKNHTPKKYKRKKNISQLYLHALLHFNLQEQGKFPLYIQRSASSVWRGCLSCPREREPAVL